MWIPPKIPKPIVVARSPMPPTTPPEIRSRRPCSERRCAEATCGSEARPVVGLRMSVAEHAGTNKRENRRSRMIENLIHCNIFFK